MSSVEDILNRYPRFASTTTTTEGTDHHHSANHASKIKI